MRIHPVISIAQLEPLPKAPDPYLRIRNTQPPPVVETDSLENDSDAFEIEALIGKRAVRRRIQYLVKWKGYGHEHNSWYDIADLEHAQQLVDDYEERPHGKLRRRARA